jgi:tellurite resistance protein
MALPSAADSYLAGADLGAALVVPMVAAIFARHVFQTPLPDALRPSQMILMAPFALGALERRQPERH